MLTAEIRAICFLGTEKQVELLPAVFVPPEHLRHFHLIELPGESKHLITTAIPISERIGRKRNNSTAALPGHIISTLGGEPGADKHLKSAISGNDIRVPPGNAIHAVQIPRISKQRFAIGFNMPLPVAGICRYAQTYMLRSLPLERRPARQIRRASGSIETIEVPLFLIVKSAATPDRCIIPAAGST